MNWKTTGQPLISIVIPSFNQGQFIEQTITSILGQNYSNIELIIIDGGSTDQTKAVIEKYSDFISHYVSEPDRGQADAINKGFRLAKGDIFAWLNSDDMYLPCTLLKVANILGASSEPKLLYGGCLYFVESQPYASGFLPPKFEREVLRYCDYIVQPSTFWSRSLWEKTGELNELYHYVLDWDWFIRASHICDFIPVQDYLSIYRQHDNHKSGTGGLKRAKEILEIVEKNASSKWISVYKDVFKSGKSLINGFNQLAKLKLYRFRILFFPKLYLKHGPKTVGIALGMMGNFDK
jgi:glycosyltransferase involved in cell wall biosynthesis